ncbi:MAG: hypothetical protein JXA41_10235 [Deltaproteobacteria bacterium]|nr:hypothetical protein [Deltaproteobacteria bacterium]
MFDLSRFSLQGKMTIITGGGRGIGKGIAEGCADAGATMVMTLSGAAGKARHQHGRP